MGNFKDATLDAETALRLQPNQDKYLNLLNNINMLKDKEEASNSE